MRDIVRSRVVEAHPEKVWDAWTKPEPLARWWGPDGFTNEVQEMDVRPGGRWRLVMIGPDGGRFPNEMAYVELSRPSRIVYEHLPPHPFKMTAVFEEAGGRTRVTMTMTHPSVEDRERWEAMGAAAGLEQTLARLAALLAA